MPLEPCKIIESPGLNIVENRDHGDRILDIGGLFLVQIMEAWHKNAARICAVGSSCMYPVRDSALREEMLGTGEVYPGNALYSYFKLLGWQICKSLSADKKIQAFIVIPSDKFGDPKDTHFITQIMKKMHAAKLEDRPSVTLWGTGMAVRHPLFNLDYQLALSHLCATYEGTDPVNIAPPVSWAKSVSSIALDIKDVVGYTGAIEFDASYPDGQPIKILDNTRLTHLGFSDFTPWRLALEKTYDEIKNDV